MGKLKDYIILTRPFTLCAPLVGFIAFGLVAWSSDTNLPFSWNVLYPILLAALSAAILNAASNILNQVFDREIDRINKPARPLPAGKIPVRSAVIFMLLLYLLSTALAWLVPNKQYFAIFVFTIFVTYAYSGPPFRTKRFGFWANLTMAIPRGGLLVVGAWSAVRTILIPEPWLLSLIFFLFILGASTTKDFSDLKGDQAGGCRTLPIIMGVRRAVIAIIPSFIVPFLLLSVFALLRLLSGSYWLLAIIGFVLAIWGAYISYLLLRRPEELCVEENHISWKHMYLLMLFAQVSICGAYLAQKLALWGYFGV
jgi:4-hydroxybenzoate polyprenyltransferase